MIMTAMTTVARPARGLVRPLVLALGLSGLGVGLATAQSARETSEDYHPDHPLYEPREQAEEEWKEDKISFPALPADEALIPFEVPGSAFAHFIDGNSVSLGKDRVTRFTVIIQAGNTRNMLYEGLRCTTREYRSLGASTGHRPFRERRGTSWRLIQSTDAGVNQFRWILWDRFVCDASSQWLDASEVVARLRDESAANGNGVVRR